MEDNVIDYLKRQRMIDSEIQQLGHRIIFDTKTGWSINVWGIRTDPTLLDASGYVRNK